MELEGKVRRHAAEVRAAGARLAEQTAYTLQAPCVLIWEERAQTTTIAALRHHLRASEALSSAPIEAYLQLVPTRGQQGAFEDCANGPDGEAFCEAWDRAQAEATQALATFDDLAAMALQAAKGWGRTPKEILVVAVEGRQVASGLVAA
jgi:hypothetical protein